MGCAPLHDFRPYTFPFDEGPQPARGIKSPLRERVSEKVQVCSCKFGWVLHASGKCTHIECLYERFSSYVNITVLGWAMSG